MCKFKPFRECVIKESLSNGRLSIFEHYMNETLTNILHGYHGLTLEELSRAPLMNRTDEKFAFLLEDLPVILDLIKEQYDVLNIDGKVIFAYTSQYFDAPDFRFFHDHHRAIPNRFKVRIRTYLDTATSYLEVKEKIKGRTDKKRIRYGGFSKEELDTEAEPFDPEAQLFLNERLRETLSLRPVMVNSYKRITLLNKFSEERLTIDFDITNGTMSDPLACDQSLSNIVIAELKQPRLDRTSPFYQLMKQLRIRPFRISKFCFGMMDLYGNEFIKSNNFKSKRLFIKKLSSNAPIRRSA